MDRRLAGVVSLVVGALALSTGTAAAATKDVKAAGNPFSGGLAFDPADVGAVVGDTVRWTNTDTVVPHTATEDHNLWDLAGDYGAGPFPRGFGPGETRERVFEAGTQRYYCKVHPEDMRGVVRVPVGLKLERKRVRVKLKRRARKRLKRRYRIRRVYTVVTTWAASVQPGLVVDAQYRRAGRGWKTLRIGSGETGARFRGGTKRRANWEVRARLRAANSSSRHTDWSPVASITT